jgi:hypothetical protein
MEWLLGKPLDDHVSSGDNTSGTNLVLSNYCQSIKFNMLLFFCFVSQLIDDILNDFVQLQVVNS